MDEQARRELSSRLSRVEGQARGVKKMLDEGQDEATILVQLLALQQASRAAATFLVKVRAAECIREQVRAALSACPGECDHCHELEAVDQALAELDLDALLQTQMKVGA
ncbi:MAG TPA: metal-sensitive transcriptional regulator [Ktedonobacteraceae bacterium]